MKESVARFQMISELQQLAEYAFIHQLKEGNPSMSMKEVREEVRNWYRVRPGAEHGDGVGSVGDKSRFE